MDNVRRGEPKERRYKPSTGGGLRADWQAESADDVLKTIAVVSAQGGALRFGYTRDGGAYSIGVYGDGQPYTVFVPRSTDVSVTLADIRDAFTPPDEKPTAVAEPQKKARR